MDRYYVMLEEREDLSASVGDVFFHQNSNFYLVPFIHSGVEFLAYFTGVNNDGKMDLDTFKAAIESNTEHKVGEKPYIFKFGLKNNFETSDMFGVSTKQKIEKLHFSMPKKLGLCVEKLLNKTEATEFYFLAGSTCEEHQKKLDLWYGRITKSLAIQYNYSPIHQDKEGGWYGYKTNA